MEDMIQVELTRNSWECVLSNLKREIERYDAEIIELEVMNLDSSDFYALQDSVTRIYDEIAGKCGLPSADE